MSISRRQFVGTSAGCASYLAAAGPFLSGPALRRWRGPGAPLVVAQAPFARIEEVGPGMFAIISTPLDGDYTTVCNGGIVGGSSGTLMVEAFARRPLIRPRAAWSAASESAKCVGWAQLIM